MNIKDIKAVKDKELQRQKEEFLNQENTNEQENEGQQKEGGALLQEIIQSIMQLQKEIKLIWTDAYDIQISKKEMKTEGKHQKKNENNNKKAKIVSKSQENQTKVTDDSRKDKDNIMDK